MVKLCASLIISDGARIVADNGNGDMDDNRCGAVTYASNMSSEMLSTCKPSYSHKMLEGEIRYDILLKTSADYDATLKVPRLGQLADGGANASGVCASGNYAWSRVKGQASEGKVGDYSLRRLGGLYEGFDQIFLSNETAGGLGDGAVKVDGKSCDIPTLTAGAVWTTCVPQGATVTLGERSRFRVVFDANGGTGTMAAQTFTKGVAQTLRTNMFVQTGCVFCGWATSANGSVVYADGQSLAVTSNTTLYAVWKICTPQGLTVTTGLADGVALAWTGPELEGLSYFVSRSESDDPATRKSIGWTAELSFVDGTATPGVRYYYWVYAGRTVMDASDLCGPVAGMRAKVSTPDPELTLASIYISGWSIMESGATRTYECYAEMSDGSRAQVSPVWSLTGGEGLQASVSTSGVLSAVNNTGVEAVVYVNASYAQNGVTKTALISVIVSPASLPNPDPMFSVTFNANGGTVSPVSRSVASGAAVGTLPTPTRMGYTFAGWYTAATGGTKVTASTKVTANATYYAHWTENGGVVPGDDSVIVTFNANGGSVTETQRTVASGAAVGELPEPVRTGYAFMGWFTAASGGVQATDATIVDADVTFYAHWTAIGWTTRSAGTGKVAIKACANPVGDIEIPSVLNGKTVVAIDNYVFFGATGLTGVVIPASVESIGVKAFKGCSNLKKVTLPKSLATLGQAAFQDCVSLTEMDVPALGDNYLWSSTFEGCTSLRRVSLPEGITAIGTSSFANCKALVEVNIPSTVKTIKSFAFFSCESLADVTLPTALVKIEQKAFKNCVSMTAVEIPSGVKTLGKAVFFNSGLVEATVPGGIAKVDDYCFQKCAALKKVTLSEGVKETGASVWANDGALEEVVFPKTLETLGGYAFFRCPSLATLWNFSSLSNLSSIGEKAFKHCTSLKSLAMPSQVTSLPKEMCNYCASLETVTGTWNVTSIGQSAFSNCPKLKSVAGLDAAALANVKRGREWRR